MSVFITIFFSRENNVSDIILVKKNQASVREDATNDDVENLAINISSRQLALQQTIAFPLYSTVYIFSFSFDPLSIKDINPLWCLQTDYICVVEYVGSNFNL